MINYCLQPNINTNNKGYIFTDKNKHTSLAVNKIFIDEELRRIENIKRLSKIISFKDNWNGYGAKSFSKELLRNCLTIICNIDMQPCLTPTARESIQMEFELPNGKYLEFEIFNEYINVLTISKDGSENEYTVTFDCNILNCINEEILHFYE